MDRIYKIYKDKSTLAIKGELLCEKELNFDAAHPIEAHPIYETELIKKVYWTDGKNQPRVINVEASAVDKGKWDETTFDFVRNLNLSETVTIVKVPLGNGLFPAGTVQYAFSYFNKYRQLSNIFYTSPLYYNTFVDRAGNVDEVVSNSYNIEITTPDTRFDYVRVYSIIRTSLDGTPVVRRLVDLVINSTNDILKFTDDNRLGDIIDPMELLYIGGEPISVGTMTSKDNTLFLGNIGLKRQEIGDAYTLLIRLEANILFLTKLLYTEDSNNSLYGYQQEFNKKSTDITTFKTGEVYRFGVQFLHISGKWSEAVWIQDKLISSIINPVLFNETNVSIYGIKGSFRLPDSIITPLWDMGYIKVRGLVVYPSVQDRNILCQGVLNPTLYNVGDRATNSPYAISSWYFRPMTKSEVISDYSKGVSLEYRHGYSLPDNSCRNSEIQLTTIDLSTFENLRNDLSSRISNEEFINDYTSNYFIDQSILTFHSPDLEFDLLLSQINNTNNLKLRIIGLTAFTGFDSNSNLTTSTGLRVKYNSGWIKPNVKALNYNNNYGVNVLASEPSYNDDNGYYAIYPWLATRSLNSAGPSDSRSAMLAKKNMLNYRYSGYNIYTPNMNLSITPITLFNDTDFSTIKLETILNSSILDVTYQGNIDKIIVPDEAFKIKCLNTTDIDVYRDTEGPDTGNESVRMLYNSSTHAVIPLNWSSESNKMSDFNTIIINTTSDGHLLGNEALLDYMLIKRLVISGPINNSDIIVINQLFNLLELDMTDANIITDLVGYYTTITEGSSIINIHTIATEIGDYMFKNMNLTHVTVPSNTTVIGIHAFENCVKLLELILNDSITEIQLYAFNNCNTLEKIILPESLISLGTGAFYNCTNLNEIQFNCGSTLAIAKLAFYGCDNIRVIFFNAITTPLIGSSTESRYIFTNTYGKTVFITHDPNYNNSNSHLSDYVADNVTYKPFLLSDVIYYNNTTDYTKTINVTISLGFSTAALVLNGLNLKNIYHLIITGKFSSVDAEYLHSKINNNYNFKNLRILDLSGVNNISNNTINSGMFSSLPLTSIILPLLDDDLSSILTDAFNGCLNLKELLLPPSFTKVRVDLQNVILKGAFNNCPNLKKITISLYDGAEITNPDSLYSNLRMHPNSFINCSNLKYIICLDKLLPEVAVYDNYIHGYILKEIVLPKGCTIVVNEGYKLYTTSVVMNLMWGGSTNSNYSIVENTTLGFTNYISKYQYILPDINFPLGDIKNVNSFWTSELILAILPPSPIDISKTNISGGLWLAELYRDNINDSTRFGGNTTEALESNIWIPAGPAVSLVTGATVSYVEGDTYILRYDCLKTYPSNKDDMQTMVESLSFLCETRVNLDARCDNNRGRSSNLLASPSNFNLMNSVYNQKNNYFNYRTLDYSKFNMDTFPNTFTWTKTKIAGELIDAWTNITMASTLDANGDYGSLKAFKIYNNEIYGFQDNAFFNVIFNSRVMIPTSDNAGIELTNNYKVEGTRYVSTTAGTRNKWGIKETPNGLYFIDDVSKSINVFNGKLNNLTDTLGFHSWVVDSIKDTTSWTPYAYNNFTTHYDCIDNNVYFVNDKQCLCYNETLGTFTSFFSYEGIPFMFNVWDNFIAVGKYLQTSETVDNVEVVTKSFNLWDLNKGDYNVFFGEHRPYYTLIIMNDEPRMDKIFNTLDFRSDTWSVEWSNRKLNRVPAIPSNICGFDLLEALNEYLYGKTNLTSEGRNTRDAVRRFRVWRTNIPRNNSQLGSTYKERMDRMRNTWLYVKLYSDGLNTNETVLHDLVVHYTV